MLSPANMTVFAGNANMPLAMRIAACLNLPLGKIGVGRFSDGEIAVEVAENVRNQEVFIVQPLCAPGNDYLMELLIMADALRRASAARITAVIPYMGYARQDRRPRSSRVPITAKVIANMIAVVGIDRVLTVDLHADQIQGFYDIPLDNVYASPVLLGDIWKNRMRECKLTVVSPDVGGMVRARALAKRLEDADLAVIDKRRAKANKAEVMNVIGKVKGTACILIDDMVDTAGTLCQAAKALKQRGASRVTAYCTHAVLSGAAPRNLAASQLDELVVTDTIPLRPAAEECGKVRQLSVATMLAESMRRICAGESLSSMFID